MSFECQVILFLFFKRLFFVWECGRVCGWNRAIRQKRRGSLKGKTFKQKLKAFSLSFLFFSFMHFFLFGGTGNSFERKILFLLYKQDNNKKNNNCIFCFSEEGRRKEKKNYFCRQSKKPAMFFIVWKVLERPSFSPAVKVFLIFFLRVFSFSCPRNSILRNHQQRNNIPLPKSDLWGCIQMFDHFANRILKER